MFLQKTPALAALFLAAFAFIAPLSAQESVRAVLADRSIDWKNPTARAQAVERMKAIEDRQLDKAKAIAKQKGKPIREELPGLGVRELVGIDEDGELLYVETRNDDAAISTGANILHAAPYSLDGSGITVGVWDADSALVTHQEFNDGPTSRINNINNQVSDDHATHVSGTIAAYGVQARAKGMAFQATIDSYDWTNDDSEMASAGADDIGQFDTHIYLSNHSYGYSYAWRYSSTNSRWEYFGTGSDQNAYDADFGQYSGVSVSMDSIAHNAPYYLIFWAAGNENNDGPSNGNTVSINGTVTTYNSSIHPPNDGDYRNDFETVADESAAKNLVVVGAANDAVTNDQRDPSKATKVGFSSTGPTDDGRIKPDLMGNGSSLYSPLDSSNTSYGNYSGTSMASPNVCGTAALLVALYRDLFGSDAAMRSSTLKGLLIHTASDLGNPGPDYKYGWGLVDAEEAAGLLQKQAEFPGLEAVIEDQVSSAEPVDSFTFSWDGVSPIRATLCWTDPAGTSQTAHDNRTPDLVNDLNLKLIAPDGTEYFPFVMPFVGTWTVASMSQNATTGVNNVDNVEQVLVSAPAQAGAWQAEVTYLGSLTNGLQDYGLIISGAGAAGTLAFNPTNYSVNENDGVATITVERVAGAAGPVSVDYTTSDGSASAGSDYTTTSGTLSWVDGESGPKTFDIPITDDSANEDYEETLSITLSDAVGTAISGLNPAMLTIFDDEPLTAVISPNGGEGLSTSSRFNITWLSSVSGDVKIELLRNGIVYYTIAESTTNDGLFEWNIPVFVATGSDYKVRITSIADGYSDQSNAAFSVEYQPANNEIYSANMDTNPGWTLQGDWAYGVPAGGGGDSKGNADPTEGYTGSNVIGFNLAGDYAKNLDELSATTPPIDCSAYTNVQLSFYRWLNVERAQFDKARIRVSNNGTDWTIVWSNNAQVTDSSWAQFTYDISAIADGESEVYIRWVMGSTDNSLEYSGWNIDDVILSGIGGGVSMGGEIAFSSTNYSVNEDVGAAIVTVNRTGGTTGAISVDYSTSDGTATAGADYSATSGTLNWADGDGASKTFTVAINNDSLLEDLLESVQLTLSNTNGAIINEPYLATLEIGDDDNNAPDVDASDDQTIYLTGADSWTPAEISVARWYDAADADTITETSGSVSQWNDKSGNANHATQNSASNRPTSGTRNIGGSNIIVFDNANSQSLNIPSVDVIGKEVWAVFIIDDYTTTSSQLLLGAGGNVQIGINSSSENLRLWKASNPYSGDNKSTTTVPVTAPRVAGWLAHTDTKKYSINGVLETTGDTYNSGDMSPTYIGKGQYANMDGAIAEIVITNGELSTSDREKMEGYLAHKWGLENDLPVDHPYKYLAPGSPTATAVLDATVNDVDGDPLTQLWTKEGGPSVAAVFDDETAVDTSATFSEVGTYTLRLTVDDGLHQPFDEVEITVELPPLAVSIADAEISEDSGTTTATITRIGTVGDLEITLSSSDTGEATVPAMATILNGNASVGITITGVTDGETDGTQTVTITASANGNADGGDTVDVTDVDASSYLNWISGYDVGVATGFTEDPDEDNLDNGIESYFGTHPGEFSVGVIPVAVDQGAGTFTFSHPLNVNPAIDISARYRWSKDLSTFYGHEEADPSGTTVTFQQGTPSGGMVNVTATVTGTATDKIFVIVEVTQD